MLRPMTMHIGAGLIVAIVSTVWSAAVASSPSRWQQDEPKEFKPIAERDRIAAVGRVADLHPLERPFFVTWADYREMPTPGPNDWLTHHAESGQSFRQFVRDRPNYPSPSRHKIYLLPVGNLADPDPKELDRLQEFAASFFMLEAAWLSELPIRENQMPFKMSEANSGVQRRQLFTDDALEFLKGQVPADAFCVLAVTMEDLVPRGKWNYVFGQASYSDRIGIFSFARLDPAFYGQAGAPNAAQQIRRRRYHVLVHEIGHMFGLKHCIHFHCLMNGSNTLVESDASPMHLCPVCLRKLHHSIGFDVRQREQKLAAVLEESALQDDAGWYQMRIER